MRNWQKYGPSARLISAVVAVVIGLVAGAQSSAAAPPIAAPKPSTTKAVFGIGPADTKGYDGRNALRYEASPGAVFSDHIEVQNIGTVPVALILYASDAESGPNGAIGFEPRANPGNGARTWISFVKNASTAAINLPAKSHIIVPLQIAVSPQATPGDHVVGVVAGLNSKVIGTGTQGQKNNLNLEQRVVLEATFRVSGAVHAALGVTGLSANYHSTWNPIGKGSATVTYTVHNTGNVVLGATQKLTVSGLWGGNASVPALGRIPQLLPGGSARVTVQVSHVTAAFIDHAKLTITPSVPTGVTDPALHAISASTSFSPIPWLLLIIIVLLVAVIIYSLLRGRGRRRYSGTRRIEKTPVPAGQA